MKFARQFPWWTFLLISLATLVAAEVQAPVAKPFTEQVDWMLVVVLSLFGLLGALPRIDPARPRGVVQQLSGGLVSGLAVGLWSAEISWFQHAPLGILAMALVAGYAGTRILDLASEKLAQHVPKGGGDEPKSV